MTSLPVNPLTLSTGILVAAAKIVDEPVIVVALPTCNCPPTALTLSFSHVVVDNVHWRLMSPSNESKCECDDSKSWKKKKNKRWRKP